MNLRLFVGLTVLFHESGPKQQSILRAFLQRRFFGQIHSAISVNLAALKKRIKAALVASVHESFSKKEKSQTKSHK